MKTLLSILISVFLLGSSIDLIQPEAEKAPTSNNRPTGITLDTLGNEVLLHFDNGQPQYYFSEIFTPVCETGVCLPIKINIYWDLSGKYLRFDQPEGEILTKLDHVPFTESDYILLHDIMSGPDPRNHSVHNGMKHSGQQGAKHSESSSPTPPAPAAPVVNLKFETASDMCDAMTGATLPEIRNRYVPGALYTSYTCWELANNRRLRMAEYTKAQLIVPGFYNHLLACQSCGAFQMTLNKLTENNLNYNTQANVLMGIIDSSKNELTVKNCMVSSLRYNWSIDTIKNTYERLYLSPSTSPSIKQELLIRWNGARHLSQEVLLSISQELHQEDQLFNFRMAVLKSRVWNENIFKSLMAEYEKIKVKDQRQQLHELIKSRAKNFNPKLQKEFRQLTKK